MNNDRSAIDKCQGFRAILSKDNLLLNRVPKKILFVDSSEEQSSFI